MQRRAKQLPRKVNRSRRGQAIVESVLGLILLTSVLLFGIYFAEIGFLSLKVQEGAYGALWEATAHRMHNTYTGKWTDQFGDPTINSAETEALNRYSSYDPEGGGGNSLTQVIARGMPINVNCRPLRGNFFSAEGVTRPPILAGAFPDPDSGMQCSSSALLASIRLPTSFLDDGLFQEPHWEDRDIRACAAGRPVGGTCEGRLGILLDDWGFNGQDEAQECSLNIDGVRRCTNTGYLRMASSVYQPVGARGAGCDFARSMVGACPLPTTGGLDGEDQFFMSFRGREHDYQETVASHGDDKWETTPYKEAGYNPQRFRCWLGRRCPPGN
jgi:hypothetical protein